MIPVLKISDIEVEEIATSFLKMFQPNVLVRPTRTDVPLLLDSVKEKYGYEFIIENLGSKEGRAVLGQTSFRHKTIAMSDSFYNQDENKTIRVPFVLAHEMGHVVLHAEHHEQLRMAGVFDEIISETKDTVVGERRLTSERDFIEHQANTFAACVLVPSSTLRDATVKVQRELGISRRLGEIYVDHNAYNRNDLQRTLSKLQLIYGVSNEVLRIRLQKLKILTGKDLNKYRIAGSIRELFEREFGV